MYGLHFSWACPAYIESKGHVFNTLKQLKLYAENHMYVTLCNTGLAALQDDDKMIGR